ncbi:hypothetical protein ANO11243_009100 [Dothideomycetidae sp. 11243]|nr:hypothetical protein ANO11243_009100 [fungal sp. No.11243]
MQPCRSRPAVQPPLVAEQGGFRAHEDGYKNGIMSGRKIITRCPVRLPTAGGKIEEDGEGSSFRETELSRSSRRPVPGIRRTAPALRKAL